MRRRCLPYLLILLVSSADLDDTWAFATPDPSDDAQAAENNEYLRAPSRPEDRFTGADESPAGPTAAPPAALRDGLPSATPLTPPPAGPALATPSLYVFMSLQR